ncbi:MAG: caspase family protein [Planctomycetaceae bacterium]|jgi:hypothetical protein|nr:caspase family protein [Planctomycetaceae bacterium]
MQKFISFVVVLIFCTVNVITKADEVTSRRIVPHENGTSKEMRQSDPHFQVSFVVNAENNTFYKGDQISFTIESEVDGYYYIINLYPRDEHGEQKFMVISPTKNHPDNKIKADQPIIIPGKKEKRTFDVEEPFGKETLVLFVSKTKLKPSFFGLESFDLEESTIDKFHAAQEKLKNDDSYEWATARVNFVTKPERNKNSKQKPREKKNAEENTDVDGLVDEKENSGNTKFALFIGIGKYQISSMPPLPAKNQVALIEKTLQNFGYDRDRIISLVDEKATRKNVIDAFSCLQESTQPGDEVVIYWCGHGTRQAATETKDSPDGLRGYLILHDTEEELTEEGEETGTLIPSTIISDIEFGDWVKDINDRRVLVVIDACFSGTFIDPKSQTRSITKKQEFLPFDFKTRLDKQKTRSISYKDAVAISSANRNEVGWAIGDKFLFSACFCAKINGIKKSASIEDIFPLTKKLLQDEARKIQERNPEFTIQTPFLQGDAGKFLLERVEE